MDAINATELGKTIWSFKQNYSVVWNKVLHERQKYLEKNHNFQREKKVTVKLSSPEKASALLPTLKSLKYL